LTRSRFKKSFNVIALDDVYNPLTGVQQQLAAVLTKLDIDPVIYENIKRTTNSHGDKHH